MSHEIAKLDAGRSEQEESRLADELTKAVMHALGSKKGAISVAIRDMTSSVSCERVSERPGAYYNLTKIHAETGGKRGRWRTRIVREKA
jgi:hypothetical protein